MTDYLLHYGRVLGHHSEADTVDKTRAGDITTQYTVTQCDTDEHQTSAPGPQMGYT